MTVHASAFNEQPGDGQGYIRLYCLRPGMPLDVLGLGLLVAGACGTRRTILLTGSYR